MHKMLYMHPTPFDDRNVFWKKIHQILDNWASGPPKKKKKDSNDLYGSL